MNARQRMIGAGQIAPTLLLLVLAASSGCRDTARCNPGTIFLQVTLAGTALTAEQIEVRATVDGTAAAAGMVTRRSGERQGSIEIQLGSRYRAGAMALVVATARAGTRLLAEERVTSRLEEGCSALTIALGTAGGDAGDARPADGPPGTDGASDAGPSGGDRPADSPGDAPVDGASDVAPDLAPDVAADRPPDTTPGCPGVCLPLTTMACGRCGSRSCTLSCTWGACQNEGICMPMAQEPCGRCLSGRRTCTNACSWGACQNEVGCVPMTTRPCDGCPGMIQTCSRECTFNACTCPPPKRVFVTRDRFTGALGGLAGAHMQCTRAANSAGLPGLYRAWLSTAQQGPATFMAPSPGPYVLPRGEMVAASWADLVDGTLLRPIDRDERGDPANPSFVCEGGEVWTNTTAAGTPRGLLDCGGWTTEASTSTSGNVKFSNARWTDSGCSVITCTSALNLYCVEQ